MVLPDGSAISSWNEERKGGTSAGGQMLDCTNGAGYITKVSLRVRIGGPLSAKNAPQSCQEPQNPYHHAIHCFGGKWKLTIIHEISHFGEIRFNRSRRALKISEKVFSEQMADLIEDGLVVRRVDTSCNPPAVFYTLTAAGKELVPLADSIFIWSIADMKRKGIPIDPDALVVHSSSRYLECLEKAGIISGEDRMLIEEIRRGEESDAASGAVSNGYYGPDPRLG